MNHDKRINSHEIARLAGVSRSTVSRVINNNPNVKPQTREKVLRVINEYSYAPDFSARMLAGKRSNTIGLFFATNRGREQIHAEDLLVDFMIERIIEIASDHDYFVLTNMIHDVYDDASRMKIKEIFTQRRIDGGIFIGFPNYFAPIEEIVAAGYVAGIMDQNIPGRNEPNRIIVNFDDETMEKAVEYLYRNGHRDIMLMMGDSRRYNGMQKEKAAYRAMEALGLKVRNEWILWGNFYRIPAKAEMERFLKNNKENMPTAILCANDNMAYGVLEALHEAGYKVPDDISVIGIDDTFMSRYTNPPLTSFHVNFEDMLRKLTENVIACIQHPFAEQKKFVFESELVVRASCKDIGHKNARKV